MILCAFAFLVIRFTVLNSRLKRPWRDASGVWPASESNMNMSVKVCHDGWFLWQRHAHPTRDPQRRSAVRQTGSVIQQLPEPTLELRLLEQHHLQETHSNHIHWSENSSEAHQRVCLPHLRVQRSAHLQPTLRQEHSHQIKLAWCLWSAMWLCLRSGSAAYVPFLTAGDSSRRTGGNSGEAAWLSRQFPERRICRWIQAAHKPTSYATFREQGQNTYKPEPAQHRLTCRPDLW